MHPPFHASRKLSKFSNLFFLSLRAGEILQILQSDRFWERAVFLRSCPLTRADSLAGFLLFVRLRALCYFSLQSYCRQNLSSRAAKSLTARKEGVTSGRKNKRPVFSLLFSSRLYNNIVVRWMRWRTRRILREKAHCKQSSCLWMSKTRDF